MKKALTVSLAQTLFTIEDDAYVILDQYLQSVRAHFANTDGQEEIIKDIESRIAEQFLESGKNIITLTEVNAVIASMGAANEFGDAAGEKTQPTMVVEAKKKLYRNPDDAVIAGVCSGLAAYFDVDVIWIRLLFVLFTLANGIGILIYIVMWMVVPEAKSASQKLEMSGSPINLATLSENVRDRVSEAAGKAGPTFKKVLTAPFVAIGFILRAIVTKLFPFIRVVAGLFLACASLCGMLALSFFASLILTSTPNKYFDFPITEVVSSPALYGSVVAGYFVLLIPALFVFLAAIALIRKKNVINASWGFGLLGLWCVAVVTAGASGFNTGSQIYEYQVNSPAYETVEKQLPLSGNKITELEVQDGYQVTLVPSTSTELVVKSREKDAQAMVFTEKDGVLTLSRQEPKTMCLFCDHDLVELILSVPELPKVVAKEGSRVHALKWSTDSKVEVVLESGARGEIDVKANEISVQMKDGARLDLTGSAVTSTFIATYGSRVEAVEFVTEYATVNAKLGARVTVQATKNLNATAEQGARIDYTGPAVVTKKIHDGARIENIWPEEPESPSAPSEPATSEIE